MRIWEKSYLVINYTNPVIFFAKPNRSKNFLIVPSKLFTVYDFRQFGYTLLYNIDKFSFRENKVLFIRHIRMQIDFDIRILTNLNEVFIPQPFNPSAHLVYCQF